MNSIMSFNKLHFSYEKQEILHGVSANIEPGGIHALFGPNGSGKTTLLKCLAGIYTPRSGDIEINGRSTRSIAPRELSRMVCYVPQEHAVSFAYTVEEVVLMGRTPHLGGVRGPDRADIEAASEAIERVGIADIADRPYTRLSGGQRQLVLIARALAQGSGIMILDEPTSALDFKNQLVVWETLRELGSSGKTILVCTHDPNHVLWFCDRVLVLREGEIIARGAVSENMNDGLLRELYGDVCTLRGGVICPKIK
ncbi:MAG: ABC transporter ATP-binding protein [Candidatus Heteroscillospira sp.]|jgi:iron complex transport system ATP-binding protein